MIRVDGGHHGGGVIDAERLQRCGELHQHPNVSIQCGEPLWVHRCESSRSTSS